MAPEETTITNPKEVKEVKEVKKLEKTRIIDPYLNQKNKNQKLLFYQY